MRHSRAAAAGSAVKNAAMRLDEITKGLIALFGDPNRVGSGPVFDEQSYAKAKPFFQASVAHFAAAGRDLTETVRALVKHLVNSGMDREAVDRMRHYVKRFVEEGAAPDAREEHPGLVIKSLETGKETKLQSIGTKPPAVADAAPQANPKNKPKRQPDSTDPLVAGFRDRLMEKEGGFKNVLDARKFARENGYDAKAGTADTKVLDEQIELAVVLAAREIVATSKTPAATYAELVALYGRQPRLAARTSKSIADQAYSTPAPLAYLASRLAGVASGKVVLEPTAGNGMLPPYGYTLTSTTRVTKSPSVRVDFT